MGQQSCDYTSKWSKIVGRLTIFRKKNPERWVKIEITYKHTNSSIGCEHKDQTNQNIFNQLHQ